ncbi:MAG: PspA/IM30 family protein [Deltaproteobacteria bacterium]|nr:PspA/IM30 family protein [Deltaproteobacteria bacterium]
MRFLTRLTNLISGVLGEWLGGRERRNPAAVYEAAIGERSAQYAKLREAAASILYLRNKLGRQLEEARRELARSEGQIELALDRDDDEAALFLIERKERLTADLQRITKELAELTTEAESAKRNLVAFHSDIQSLREEKTRMLARLANAQARLRLQRALNGVAGLTPDADIQALEAVREYIERTIGAITGADASGDGGLDARLDQIRSEQALHAARAQLEERKRSRRRLLPLILPKGASVVAG